MNDLGSESQETAVLELTLPGQQLSDTLPLDIERRYAATLRIRDQYCGGADFRSPIGDEKWGRIIGSISSSTHGGSQGRTDFNNVYDAGRRLYEVTAGLNTKLRSFLADARTPRRLVIASDRPEMHRLPWEAMFDSQKSNLAHDGLSIVHADLNTFDHAPRIAGERISIYPIIDPDTERSTLDAIRQLRSLESTTGERGPIVAKIPEGMTAAGLRKELLGVNPDVVHVEAHGDNETGEIKLTPDLVANPRQVAELFGERLMVLFWSCYSGMVHSWGESLGLLLQRSGTPLVLGFSTPLQYKTARALATKFYSSLLDPRSGGDPESVLVHERARLFEEERDELVWASMSVWLRCPLDLSPALVDGPRIPQTAWTDAPISKVEGLVSSHLTESIRGATAGKVDVVEGERVPSDLPEQLVSNFPGAVVRLEGATQAGASLDKVLGDLLAAESADENEIEPESTHWADILLTLLEVLKKYRSSLLIWSNASPREVALFRLLEEIPTNVAVLLVTSETLVTDELTAAVGHPVQHKVTTTLVPEEEKKLSSLETLVERGRYEEALAEWSSLGSQAASWEKDDPVSKYLRYQIAGYWTHIKQRQTGEAKACIDALEEACKVLQDKGRQEDCYPLKLESRLLLANWHQRRARPDLARTLYHEARQIARERNNYRDLGRAGQELAYLSAELGDRVLAEKLCRESIQQLGRAGEESRNEVWSSALGRVLRDYADLIVTDLDRSAEVRRLLHRSIAIHVLDGRYDQLAAALRTRGRLAAVEGDEDAAEAAFERSVAICRATRNDAAWASTMREMAEQALNSGRYLQCRNILTQLIENPRLGKKDRGLVAMRLARTYWRLGELQEVLRWCRKVQELLPEEMIHEQRQVRYLEESARSLLGKD